MGENKKTMKPKGKEMNLRSSTASELRCWLPLTMGTWKYLEGRALLRMYSWMEKGKGQMEMA